MNSTDLVNTTQMEKDLIKKDSTGLSHGSHGLITPSHSQIKETIKEATTQLPESVKLQMHCIQMSMQPLSDLNLLTPIYDTVKQLKKILQTAATLIEIDRFVSEVFLLMPGHNKTAEDIAKEKLIWCKILEGEPAWAIEGATISTIRNKTWRNLAEFLEEVHTQTYDIKKLISNLKNLEEITLEHHNQPVDILSYEDMMMNFEIAAKNGSTISKLLLDSKKQVK